MFNSEAETKHCPFTTFTTFNEQYETTHAKFCHLDKPEIIIIAIVSG